MLNIFLYNFITPPLRQEEVAEGQSSVLINIYCHSPFLHLLWFADGISSYVKMQESSFYKNASKNDSLPQSPS